MNARVEELFHEVANLNPEERSHYFAEHDVDEQTREEVEALLAADSGASGFLLREISLAASLALPQLEGRGWRCGPYRLLDVIGRGGMGAVYLAERADGEVTQRLAVKLLPPGAGDSQRDRFLQERQILASLEHPNIARMLDAGHIENGQPFLAMEYVEGKPIDAFAAELSVREEIKLFLKVCAAVGYLHRNLVVHRDLKPSNILVTADGEPKLLDFGIAKMLDVATDSTMTSMRMLTPDYASPEQVTGGRVSTATDIYSLGAVLYTLLTGKPAHEFADHSPEGVAREITGREVTPPSKWSPELKGDLEFILLKALRKDPRERYATVEQFADDLQAFLESRTVRARSGNAWYRTRKFLRRYWVPVGAAALVIASLATGLFMVNRERFMADRQRAIAERRFQQLRQLSNKVFDLDRVISNLPGATQARQSLVSASLEYLEGLASDVRGDVDLAREIGLAYGRVARVQGVPVVLNLGEPAKAELSLKKADELLDMVLAARPKDRIALLRSADIAHDRMILAQGERRNTDAVTYGRRSADRLETFLRLGDSQNAERENAAVLYGNIALVHVNLHLYERAAAYARREVELGRSSPSGQRQVSAGLSVLAEALRYQGDLAAALQAIEEARVVAGQTVYPDETVRMITLTRILRAEGDINDEDGGVSLDRPVKAVEVLQTALDLAEAVARKDPNDATSRIRVGAEGIPLGNILRHRDPRRALAVYDLTFRRLGEVRKDVRSRQDQALALAGSSYALRSLHRTSEARQRIDAALMILTETKDYPTEQIKLDSETFIVLRALADHEADSGAVGSSIELYEQLLNKVMAANPDPLDDLRDAPRMSKLYEALEDLYRRTDCRNKAEGMKARRLDLWRQWDRKLPNNPFVQRQLTAKPAL